MNTYRPGLFDSLWKTAGQIAEVVSKALGPVREALFGLEIRRNAHVPIGKPYYIDDPEVTDGRRILICHPLDAIAVELKDDPLTRLDEAIAWIVERAERELDSVNIALGYRETLGRHRQTERMAAFMTRTGVDGAELRAAELLQGHFTVTGQRHPTLTVEKVADHLRSCGYRS